MRPALLLGLALASAAAASETVDFDRIEAIAIHGAAQDPKSLKPQGPDLIDRRPAAARKDALVTRREVAREAAEDFRRLSATLTGAELHRRRRECWRGAIDRLLDRSLLLQASREAGVDVSDEEIRPHLRRHREGLGIATDDRFAEVLQARGTSLEALREDYRRRVAVDRFLDRTLPPSPPPSPDEILAYYAEHVAEFAAPQEAQLRQILLQKSRFPSREELELEMKEIWSLLRSGEDFGEVAKRHSHASSAPEGGLLPYLPVTSLNRDLQRLLQNLPTTRAYTVNDTLTVQEDEESIAIVRVDGIRQGKPREPAEVQDEILERIRREDGSRRRDRVVEMLRKRAYLWISDAEPPPP